MNYFDGTIHLGDVITVVVIGIGLWAKSRTDRDRFTRIETKVGIIYTWFEKHVLNGRKGD